MFLLCFDRYNAQHNTSFAAAKTFHKQTFLHKHCFYTSTAFTQALLLNKPCFFTKAFLHKTWFYTNPVFTQALSLHKHCFYTKAFLHKNCFYTNAVFTQALSLHKHCFYTRPAFTQKRFYTRPPFTQTLSLHKLCLYTAFIHALLLHNDILLRKVFCNLQTGNRLEGRRNAEGCKYPGKKRTTSMFFGGLHGYPVKVTRPVHSRMKWMHCENHIQPILTDVQPVCSIAASRNWRKFHLLYLVVQRFPSMVLFLHCWAAGCFLHHLYVTPLSLAKHSCLKLTAQNSGRCHFHQNTLTWWIVNSLI